MAAGLVCEARLRDGREAPDAARLQRTAETTPVAPDAVRRLVRARGGAFGRRAHAPELIPPEAHAPEDHASELRTHLRDVPHFEIDRRTDRRREEIDALPLVEERGGHPSALRAARERRNAA